MELLRIVAMLLVMAIHANFLSFGRPVVGDGAMSAFGRIFACSLSQVCVNLFVLVSGWYGIRFKLRGVCNLLFQVAFYVLLIWAVMRQWCFDYWFVWAYLGLYIISPVLNAFVEKATKREFGVMLICFYVFQTIFGWALLEMTPWIAGGYSTWSFVGLYLLARYLRLYPIKWNIGVAGWLGLYFGMAFLLTSVGFGMEWHGIEGMGRFVSSYTNPLSILEAVCLVMAFSKMKFESKIVNWVATSSFAVYLIHANELILRTYYAFVIRWSYDNYGLWMIAVMIVGIFVASVLVDKVRVLMWKPIEKLFI